eukprot:5111331-Pleurochrysis_carterae.AAC.2
MAASQMLRYRGAQQGDHSVAVISRLSCSVQSENMTAAYVINNPTNECRFQLACHTARVQTAEHQRMQQLTKAAAEATRRCAPPPCATASSLDAAASPTAVRQYCMFVSFST